MKKKITKIEDLEGVIWLNTLSHAVTNQPSRVHNGKLQYYATSGAWCDGTAQTLEKAFSIYGAPTEIEVPNTEEAVEKLLAEIEKIAKDPLQFAPSPLAVHLKELVTNYRSSLSLTKEEWEVVEVSKIEDLDKDRRYRVGNLDLHYVTGDDCWAQGDRQPLPWKDWVVGYLRSAIDLNATFEVQTTPKQPKSDTVTVEAIWQRRDGYFVIYPHGDALETLLDALGTPKDTLQGGIKVEVTAKVLP